MGTRDKGEGPFGYAWKAADPKQTAHTPCPWEVETSELVISRPFASEGDAAITAGKMGVAVTCSYLRSKEEQIANAQFIVRCVNSHDKLVAALEAMHGIAQGLLRGECYDRSGEKFLKAFADAEAALRAAKGGHGSATQEKGGEE